MSPFPILAFYKRREDAAKLRGITATPASLEALLPIFNRGNIPVLKVPVLLVTGWRSTRSVADTLVVFLGSPSYWTVDEQAQALSRLTLKNPDGTRSIFDDVDD